MNWFYAREVQNRLIHHQDSPIEDNPKVRDRDLQIYADMLVGEPGYRKRYDAFYDELHDFFRLRNKDLSSLETESHFLNFLNDLKKSNNNSFIWVDFGGGLGLAQRELKVKFSSHSQNSRLVLFDGIDWMSHKSSSVSEMISYIHPELLLDSAAPEIIVGDFERPVLDFSPQLITAIEAFQYSRDKMRTFVNWYNLLADNGFLFIVSEGRIALDMRTEDQGLTPHSLTRELISQLRSLGIKVKVRYFESLGDSQEPEIEAIMIQKKPGSRLSLRSRVIDVFTNAYKYEIPTYSKDFDLKLEP